MKKFLLILCSVFLLTGCSDKTAESSISDINSESQAESQTETPKKSENELPVTKIAENIKLYDLTFPENKEYLQNHAEFSYGNEYEMSGGKISEENGNIYFEYFSGERKALIELPVESETVYVVISCIIDDKRFAYNIIQEDSSLGCGVYNLFNNEDFRIESADRCHYYPKEVLGDYLILTRGFIADFYGYSKLNLKTFQLTDIDTDFIENKRYLPCTAFSADMKMTANISTDYSEDTEYNVTLFSLENEKVTEEYKFSSENRYVNFDLKFVSDNKLYIYALKEGDSEFNYLYVIDLPVVEIADNIKLYDLTVPENAEYRPKNFVAGLSYEMLGHGTIKGKDGNIILETLSGENKVLISNDDYHGYVGVDIICKIDDNRFVYHVIAEESNIECGIYNLETDEKFIIENNTEYTMNYPYNPQYIAGNYLILYKGWVYSGRNFSYSRLDLDTLEINDVDSKYISEEQRYPKVAFSQDGKTAAVFSGKNENGEYVITLFSVDDDTKIAEYKFSSENEYTSFTLEFKSEYQLYVYAHEKDNVGSNYLYAIDIPHIPELNDWQKAYKQALFDFMDSNEYFSGSDIIEHSAFSIYDLNTDGTPELIISEDTSHAGNCHIYTYDDGLIYLNRMGAYGDIGYYEDNGMIVHYNLGQGIEYEIFNRLENDQINIVANFYNDVGYRGDEGVFKLNDTEITKDEYDAKLAEYRGTEYVSLGRDYSFDEIYEALTEYSRIIGRNRASELLWNCLKKYDNRHIAYGGRQKFDDRTYYIFRCYEDYDDRRVTTGWYAVDIFTGDCYNTNTLTELTPLINEEKNFSYKITESGGVEIYSDGEFYQSLDVTINNNILDMDSRTLVRFVDYDFDGYNDIAVEERLGATNAGFRYFRYDPDTEYFESWFELDDLHFYITINNDKTLSVHSKASAVDAEYTTYKWSGNVLVPVSKEKRYSKGRDIFMDYLEYDDYGNETLVKREKYILDENGDMTGTVDVTP